MGTTITCFGSAGEIGGNKILIEDDGNRLMLDFGMAFGRTGEFFDGVFVAERAGRGLLDPIALGLVPPLRGLLRDDLVPGLVRDGGDGVEGFWRHWQTRFPNAYRDLRRDGPAVDAVLISHAHLDHIADLEYVRGDIPMVSTCTTAFIAKVLQDIGGGSGAAYIHPATTSEAGIIRSDRSAGCCRRPWHFLDQIPSGDSLDDPLAYAHSFWNASGTKNGHLAPANDHGFDGKIGPWRVKWWPVDHSIPGAIACGIETSAGWVGYSGDIRFHGRQGAATWQAAEEMAALKPVALLCEGTRLTGPNATTEAEVYENCRQVVQRAAGRLVIADFAPRNVERFEIFARIAEETGRRLLVQPKDAYLLRAMALADPVFVDLMNLPQVAVYDDPKCVYRKYEAAVRARYADRIVSPDEVRWRLGDYILAFSLTDMADLLDLEYLVSHGLDGVWIFSNSPAYDDEQQVDLVRLWNWAQHLGLALVGLQPRRGASGQVVAMDVQTGYHASGHAGGDELKEFVQRIAPRTLIPIHTQASHLWPQMLAGRPLQIIQPQSAHPIRI